MSTELAMADLPPEDPPPERPKPPNRFTLGRYRDDNPRAGAKRYDAFRADARKYLSMRPPLPRDP